MNRRALFLLPLLCVLPAGAGADKFDPEALARTIAPFIDEHTYAIVRVDLSRVNADAFLNRLAAPGTQDKELAAKKEEMTRWLASFAEAGGKDLYLLFAVMEPF